MHTSSPPLSASAPARHLFRLVILSCLLLSACLPPFTSRQEAQRPAPPEAPRHVQTPAALRPLSPDSLCFSLALPLQGPARSIAEKIMQGASIAKREMESQGGSVHVRMLDTDQPDWLDQLAALPPACALVGGPMHTAAYNAAKQSPAARGRAFFTFLPQLAPGDEGFAAWRFFPSPQDQADALLSFTQIEMGFTSYGILYPDAPYGRRMADIFRQRAALRGAATQATGYTPTAAAEWPHTAAKLVGRQEINKTPFPTARLEAIFLPDSWFAADQLITSLHYNGEDRAILLGDSLWGEGIPNKPPALPQNYQLAVFPGPWNPGLASQGAQALQAAMQGAAPDFWIGLGYDFLHFAAHMKLVAGWTPKSVNLRAADARRTIAWSMAPITWDAQGRASQALFLFTPVAGGFTPVQPDQLKSAWQEAQTRFAERMRIAQGESAVPSLLQLSRPAAQPAFAPATATPGTPAPTLRQAAPVPDAKRDRHN